MWKNIPNVVNSRRQGFGRLGRREKDEREDGRDEKDGRREYSRDDGGEQEVKGW